MPDVSAAGTYSGSTAGWEKLKATRAPRVIMFGGTSLGDSCVVQWVDDQGVAHTIPKGTVSSLPTWIQVDSNIDLQVVFTGTPDCNVSVGS